MYPRDLVTLGLFRSPRKRNWKKRSVVDPWKRNPWKSCSCSLLKVHQCQRLEEGHWSLHIEFCFRLCPVLRCNSSPRIWNISFRRLLRWLAKKFELKQSKWRVEAKLVHPIGKCSIGWFTIGMKRIVGQGEIFRWIFGFAFLWRLLFSSEVTAYQGPL